jgi:hypothetical protein
MRAKSLIAILSLGLALFAGRAVAQMTTAQPVTPQTAKVQVLKFKGLVISATSIAMTLSSQQNPKMIQTFSYSPQVRQQMADVIQKGGYQHGDKVTVDYAAGTTVALRIHGKPSKTS